MKKIYRSLKSIYLNFIKFISHSFYLIRIKNNKVIFTNFFGNGYGCNPKYICEQLNKANKNLDIIWVSKDSYKSQFPKNIKLVKPYSLKFYYNLITAKVWVSNIRNIYMVKKRKSQIYYQTWHGDFALKNIEREAEAFLSQDYLNKVKFDSKQTDYFITACNYFTDIVKKYFWYEGKILEYGNARTDAFFNENVIRKKVFEFYNLPTTKKIILYCPTFRKQFCRDVYEFDYNQLIFRVNEVFGVDSILLIRLHPNDRLKAHYFDGIENTVNASEYSDIEELLVASDFLITDYSSVILEFGLTQKPAFLFCPDLDQYIKTNRDLKPLFYSQPYPRAENLVELLDNISNYKKETLQKVKEFYNNYHFLFDGHASERIVESILKEMKLTIRKI